MSPAHADWSDDATVIPAPPINVNTPHTPPRIIAICCFTAIGRNQAYIQCGVSIPNRWPKKDPQNANMEQIRPYHHPTLIQHLAGRRAPGILSVVIAQPTAEEEDRGANIGVDIVKKRRSGTVSFRASRADVDVLRRRVLAKASLIMV